MAMQTKLFSFSFLTHVKTEKPAIEFVNELQLFSKAQRWAYMTPAWYDHSADVITTWREVGMTHEQRTFGPSPKCVTVTITCLTCYVDFAVMVKTCITNQEHFLWFPCCIFISNSNGSNLNHSAVKTDPGVDPQPVAFGQRDRLGGFFEIT